MSASIIGIILSALQLFMKYSGASEEAQKNLLEAIGAFQKHLRGVPEQVSSDVDDARGQLEKPAAPPIDDKNLS